MQGDEEIIEKLLRYLEDDFPRLEFGVVGYGGVRLGRVW